MAKRVTPLKTQKHLQTNNRFKSRDHLIHEVSILRTAISEKEKKIAHLEKMITADNRGTILSENEHSDMLSIMKEHHDSIINTYPDGSFQRIFWMSQYQAAQSKSHHGFRWNHAMLKWCVFLCHKSSKAYDLIRKTKTTIKTNTERVYQCNRFVIRLFQ